MRNLDEVGKSFLPPHYIPRQCVGTEEIPKFLTAGVKDGVLVTLPKHIPLVNEGDSVSNLKDGVDVMRVHDGSDVEFPGQT